MGKYGTADGSRRDCKTGKSIKTASRADGSLRGPTHHSATGHEAHNAQLGIGKSEISEATQANDDISASRDSPRLTEGRDYLSLIGGAVFSAGAGGSAGWAPAFCAPASGRAGSGGTSGGLVLVPVVTGSAGADGFVSAPGVDCTGGVACAVCCRARTFNLPNERAEMTSPVTTSVEATIKPRLKRRFVSSTDISFAPRNCSRG